MVVGFNHNRWILSISYLNKEIDELKKDHRITPLTSLIIWCKIGIQCFGGAVIMPSVAENELVEKRRLITNEEFLDLYARSKIVPGALNISMGIVISYYLGGWKAGVTAALGLAIPSILMIILVFTILSQVTKNPGFEIFFQGIKPVIPGLVAGVAFRMGRSVLKKGKDFILLGVLAGVTIFFRLDSLLVLLLSGIGGLLLFFPERKK